VPNIKDLSDQNSLMPFRGTPVYLFQQLGVLVALPENDSNREVLREKDFDAVMRSSYKNTIIFWPKLVSGYFFSQLSTNVF
jgi:hypothetical protein